MTLEELKNLPIGEEIIYSHGTKKEKVIARFLGIKNGTEIWIRIKGFVNGKPDLFWFSIGDKCWSTSPYNFSIEKKISFEPQTFQSKCGKEMESQIKKCKIS